MSDFELAMQQAIRQALTIIDDALESYNEVDDSHRLFE